VREIGRPIEPFKHGTIVLVAVAYTALALSNGGSSQRLTAAATIAVWLAVAVGAAARVWSLRRVPRSAVVAGGCVAGLGALTALSMLWADDAGRAFAAFVRVAGYVGLFTLVALCVPKSGVRAWLAGLVVGLTIVCLASLGTRFDPSLFGNGDRSLGVVLPTAQGRLSYPIGYWNGLAACLAIQAILLLWFGAHGASRRLRALAVGLIPLPGLALYLTSSRGGFAAAVAGGLVLVALERRRVQLVANFALGAAGGALLIAFAHSRGSFLDGLANSTAKDQGLEVGLAALLCVLVVGFVRYQLDRRLAELRLPPVSWRVAVPLLIVAAAVAVWLLNPESHINEAPASAGAGPRSGHLLSAGGSNRSQYWEAALNAFASKPVTGIGAGNFALYWNAHPETALPLLNAHSLYLETLAELGILGLLFVLGFFAAAVSAGWRARDVLGGGEAAPALAVLGAGAVTAAIEWSFQIPAAFVPVIVVAGLLTAAPSKARAAAPAGASTGSPSPFGLGIAVIAIAWASIWAAGTLLVSDYKLDASRGAASRDDLAAAASDARDAAMVQPWSPEPRLQLGLVEELGGDLKAARNAIGLAIDRAPGDWRPWAAAARIDARAGNLPAAGTELLRAEELSPIPLPNEFVDPVRQEARRESSKRALPLLGGGGEHRD
jgi:hypothetical protein